MSEKDPNSSETPASEFATVDGAATQTGGGRRGPSYIPEQLGNYQIVGVLGSGGMGIVLKAHDPALNRYAAIKLIRTEHPELAVRFVQEARAQARVQHENVCRVYEAGEVEGKQYIAMQLIEGDTLSQSSREMSREAKLLAIRQIAEALHVAHKQGLIHRDIKPSNIMLEKDEEGKWKPYILDFGLAREQDAPGLTRTGVSMGTPHYMSPEQVSNLSEQLDRRTDVYGLGATLYELLCGRPPYQGNSGPEIMLQILKDDPVPIGKLAPGLPQDLETIVMKCLERDPSRRYDSAKSLSEDLQRYLDGDPLSARPTSWSYRVMKRAKKNRLASGIAIAAAILTVILVASFFWIQWQHKLEAAYAREFGDEIKSIQSVLPRIYTAPLHDVRPELAALRKRLEKIEARVKEGGRAAWNPGNNALGQGYLALGEIEKARDYLERAWQKDPLPSTAYALGQTMGLLFQKKLAEVERISGESVREKLKQRYEKEFRDRAVHYLKQAEGNVESPAYVEGLIALYERRFEDALKKSREAYAKSSWSYEAKTLEGKAHAGIAQNLFEKADYKGTNQQYHLAGEAYAKAAELGRSRADIYLSDCDRWGKTMQAQRFTDEDPTVSLPKAEEACNKAILVNPDDPTTYLRKAFVYTNLGRFLMHNSSVDPIPLFKKSREASREAQRRDPKSWEAPQMLLSAFMQQSEYELRHGIDPRNSVNEAIKQANLSLSIRPDNTVVLLNLGVTLVTLGEYEEQTGKNPIPTFRKAIEQYRKMAKIDKSINTGNEAGIAYWFIAQYQGSHGEDPSESYRHAVEEYQNSLKQAPDDPYVLYNLGILYGDQGNYESAMGKDPTVAFRRALESIKKAAKFIPNNSYITNSIGNTNANLAEFLLSQKKDPTSELQEARKFLTQSSQIDASYYMPYTNLGFVEIIEANWAIEKGKSPLPSFELARQAYLKSIELNKEEPATYRAMADIYLAEAEWKMKQKLPAETSIVQGLQWVEKSLSMSKDAPKSIAVHGALFLLQARTEQDSAKRSRYAVTAVTELEKAIKMNPLLQKDYDSYLKEAKTL